mmetsp:Transcript_31001/g.89333  ORF Transcript_31001/g.89333 Transcript_31001/m.89333 type:complete len:218 (-) Transcript_31001:77-730(-)|eukprot:CAMPEP_0177469682 /NCGR_PEP_ID=MMETSP0369-20130122/19784_1 /TAXON_ID=447022 ORGANISM="Scrippsiella hangoei-like, Strain SHHI-4" /NCGR_SAMPLE_ID=MMETSP0369 /ASSEMBLY_ACC=CAM_ASM_000364 /LENGTH=217 /DNA_ID=CAMNT_0018944063 /DNA_START=68 /DNA_END=721 /DNA_ORIENTATION=-
MRFPRRQRAAFATVAATRRPDDAAAAQVRAREPPKEGRLQRMRSANIYLDLLRDPPRFDPLFLSLSKAAFCLSAAAAFFAAASLPALLFFFFRPNSSMSSSSEFQLFLSSSGFGRSKCPALRPALLSPLSVAPASIVFGGQGPLQCLHSLAVAMLNFWQSLQVQSACTFSPMSFLPTRQSLVTSVMFFGLAPAQARQDIRFLKFNVLHWGHFQSLGS